MTGKRVFLSYGREDEATALRLQDDLCARGIETWFDKQNLRPGEDWREAIRAALEQCRFVIVLLSSRTVGKKGFVQNEIRLALQVLEEHPPSSIYLIPVRIDECEPQHRRLRELNWVDLFPSYSDSLARLVAALAPPTEQALPAAPTRTLRSIGEALSIVNVGSITVDFVETPSGNYERVAGSSVYFAAAASIFAPVRVLSVVGSDFDFDSLGFLQRRSVDLAGIAVEEGKTFKWWGRYAKNLQSRTTLDTKLGTFGDFAPSVPLPWMSTPLLYLGNIHPALQVRVARQMQGLELAVLDTMNFWIQGERRALTEALSCADGLIVNDEELSQLTGALQIHAGARQLVEDGLKFVVVKRGEYGAMLVTSTGVFAVPAFPHPKLTDPTGAGDTFGGGFMGYLANVGSYEDRDLRQAMIYGTVLGSFAVEAFGADRLQTLTLADVENRIDEYNRATSMFNG